MGRGIRVKRLVVSGLPPGTRIAVSCTRGACRSQSKTTGASGSGRFNGLRGKRLRRIEETLGQGGMGVVYEAMQISLKRVVALKILAPHLSEDLSRELDAGRTLRILTPIADALDSAHAAGLIHLDVKPQNILVGGRDQPFLADFGLTKAPGEKSLTKTGQFVGTFDYVSPEQIKGERATAKSDVYALAAVLYECLTGVVPYPKDSEAAVLYAHMADDPPQVSDQRPDLPAALDSVLAKAMSKDPAERNSSPGDLLADTRRAFDRKIRAAISPPGPIELPQETGIRPAEVEVPTREAPSPPDQETDPAAPQTQEGEADRTAAHAEQQRTAAEAQETAAEAEPQETVPREYNRARSDLRRAEAAPARLLRSQS